MYLRQQTATKLKQFTQLIRKYSSAYLSENQKSLIVDIEKQKEEFPLVWLRDNCRCPLCFHENSTSRTIKWVDFNVRPKVKSVLTESDKGIVLNWNDDHVSKFSIDWLRKRSFREDVQEKYILENYRPSKVSWSKETFDSVKKTYEFENVIKDDEVLHSWITDLARYGMVFIKNAPNDKHIAAKVARRASFIRKTHYEDEFEVKNVPGTTNVAYVAGALQLHTDLPYYEYTPGVILLHCLVPADGAGGESLLSDGFYHAEKLREEHKEAFDILSSVEVNWLDIGSEHGEKYHKIHRSPVIRLDLHGNIEEIHHSVPQRDSHFTTNLRNVKPWYEAMKLFVNSITHGANAFKLNSGDMMAIDNNRLLHGRSSYEDKKDKERHLMGVYMDWDELFSKMRVLKPLV